LLSKEEEEEEEEEQDRFLSRNNIYKNEPPVSRIQHVHVKCKNCYFAQRHIISSYITFSHYSTKRN
jgi:hypothetical protein